MTINPIIGAGGGGGKKGAAAGEEAKNTLRSSARARILLALSEGKVGGPVDGDKSIYINETPLQARDGTYNYRSVDWQFNPGLPDQPAFRGNGTVETPHGVEVQVKKADGPIVRTITDQNATLARLVMRIPALVKQTSKGALEPANLSYRISVRPYNGVWTVAETVDIKQEKTTSAYQRQHAVVLPTGGYPWDIRVERLNDDSTDTKLQNDLFWESYFTVVEGLFTYPNTAVLQLEVDAKRVGGSLPSIAVHMKGIEVEIPTNYDPVTRAYTGIWDGTFKLGVTANPAWVYRDLVVNDRYGLGEFVTSTQIDKWGLYQIARYCDELVPSGFKDANGGTIMEPRFTFNAVINSRQEAFRLLASIATAFRGMGYWALGQVFAIADMPADPVKLVTPANVIDGEFTYNGTALKARHSVALVQWNDPSDFFKPATEVVINDRMLHRFGWRETTVQLTGCTSRGQARRFGSWLLDTEETATETIEYVAAWDHVGVRPGDLIAVADPKKAALRMGGRVAPYEPGDTVPDNAAAQTFLRLDAPFTTSPGQTYRLMVELSTGAVETRDVTAIVGSKVSLAAPFSELIRPNALWVLTATDTKPRQFRVIAIAETDGLFKVTALQHDPAKFARVEQGVAFDEVPYTRLRNGLDAPTNLAATEQQFIADGAVKSRLTLSWTPQADAATSHYVVNVLTPDQGLKTFDPVTLTSIDIDDVVAGDYVCSVAAVSPTGLVSPATETTVAAGGWSATDQPTVTDLKLVENPAGVTFVGRNVAITWSNVFPGGEGSQNPFFLSNTVKVYDSAANQLLRTETVTGTTYTYTIENNRLDSAVYGRSPARHLRFEVVLNDTLGRISPAATLAVTNAKPAAPTLGVTPAPNALLITWVPPADLDVAGSKVWVSTNAAFDPAQTVAIYEGPNTQYTFPGTPGTTYYVRVACFDSFDTANLNVSNQVSGVPTIAGNPTDTTPPVAPTSLTVTTGTAIQATGEVMTRLIATWPASASSDVAYYDLQVLDGVNWLSYLSIGLRYEVPARAGTTYSLRVRAIDKAGNASGFFGPVDHTTTGDTIAPSVPTGFSATGLLKSVLLTWSTVAASDLSHYEIFASDGVTAPTSGSGATWRTARSSVSFVEPNVAPGATRNYWLRAVDTSGNRSAWSAMVSAVAVAVNSEDIAANAIVAGKIAAEAITGVELAVQSIATEKLTIGGVTTDRIALNAVTQVGSTYTAESVGGPNSLAWRRIGSFRITRTPGCQLVISVSWYCSLRANVFSSDSTYNVRVVREGVEVLSRGYRVPYQGKDAGTDVYGGECFLNFVDSESLSGSILYDIQIEYTQISKRFVTYQEFKR